jgi:hypothetical protein
LSKCGLPRQLSEGIQLKELLMKAKNKEEMTKLADGYKEAWQAGVQETFAQVGSVGFTELSLSQTSKTNDNLFK